MGKCIESSILKKVCQTKIYYHLLMTCCIGMKLSIFTYVIIFILFYG